MRKDVIIEDLDFEKLIKDVQDLARKTPGTPDVYSLIAESLFGSIEGGVPNDEYEFAANCLGVIIEMGYGVQELMPWE